MKGDIFNPYKIKAIIVRAWAFQILDRINDHAYKVDLTSEYGVNVTFNVFFILHYLIGDDDSRSNLFKERRDDKDQPSTTSRYGIDPLVVPKGFITRVKIKRLK